MRPSSSSSSSMPTAGPLALLLLLALASTAAAAKADKECAGIKHARVAVLIPSAPDLHRQLKGLMLDNARNLMRSNPCIKVQTFIDGGPIETLAEDTRPLSKTARLRNRMIDSLDLKEWDYVLWIDADVVEYPPNLPTLLLKDHPNGVTAPTVLIEEPGPAGPNQFYDTTAFTLKGQHDFMANESFPYVAGRSVELFYPWVPGPWADTKEAELVNVDGVGTVYMVPAEVFRKGHRYADHERLTEHWSIVEQAHEMKYPVKMHRGVLVRHAHLPKYGHHWHTNANRHERAGQ